MRPILFLALKDLHLVMRDRAAAFFAFIFPLAIALFFGFVFSGTNSEPLRVAAFSEQESPASAALLQALSLDEGFRLEVVQSREIGEQRVRGGRALALVVVPKLYAEGLDGMFTGEGAKLDLVLDPSRRAEGAMLVGKIHEVAFRTVFSSINDPAQFARMMNRMEAALKSSDMALTDQLAIRVALSRMKSMLAKGAARPEVGSETGSQPKAPGLSSWMPVAVEVSELSMRAGVPSNGFAISFMQGIVWALLGSVSAFGSGFAEERERGTMLRLVVSPMSRWQILAGKALACFAACLLTQWLLITIGVLFCHVEVSNWMLMTLVTAVTAFCFSGIMMFLAAGFRTLSGSQGAGRAVLLVLAMIGGGSVPLVFMPPFLQTLSNFSPFKWAVTAVEGATWRSWGIAELTLPIAVLCAIGAVSYLFGALVFRRAAAM